MGAPQLNLNPSGEEDTTPPIVLRLYIANDAPNSKKAKHNLATICRDHFADRCDIETVDVLDKPQQALADNVLVIPSLLRISPLPQIKITGDLSQTDAVLALLAPP